MKCSYSENDIALFVERDMAPSRVREMEEHLAICDSCRELAGDLQDTQSVFKGLKQDTVSAGALAAVRTKVLAEVGARSARPVWGRWIYALAGAAFVAVMAVGVASYSRRPVTSQIQQVVKSDPLPSSLDASPYRVRASRAVPLFKGDNAAPPVRTVKVKGKGKGEGIVPLEKGDDRVRQWVALDEIPSEEPPKQLVVKLLTDDPNIVIYWLVDQKGGTL